MELTARQRPRHVPVLAVPDPETMAFWGHPLDAGAAARGPRWLLLPARIPSGLERAVRAAAQDPATIGIETVPTPARGRAASEVLADHDERPELPAGHEHEHGHEGHGDMGDHDMMAIVGEPSADGLVMEDIELRAGPLGVALPGGLVVLAGLDGDVVTSCEIRSELRQIATAPASPRDPLAPVAWTLATMAAARPAGEPRPADWLSVAALELERAVSHLCWLLRLMRLIGWRAGHADVLAAARPLLAPNRALAETIGEQGADHAALLADVSERGSRLPGLAGRLRARPFAARTAQIGVLSADACRRAGVEGPSARAAGAAPDLRGGDPVYQELRFAPAGRDRGDAHARAEVRLEEAVESLRLVARALELFHAGARPPARPFAAGGSVAVESARGPMIARPGDDGGPQVGALGERALRQAASSAAVGREWASALVAIASFDLSPWDSAP
jgi:hypothetical protein